MSDTTQPVRLYMDDPQTVKQQSSKVYVVSVAGNNLSAFTSRALADQCIDQISDPADRHYATVEELVLRGELTGIADEYDAQAADRVLRRLFDGVEEPYHA